MAPSIEEYLESLQTHQLQTIYTQFSRPENLEHYDYCLPIIEEILKKRGKNPLSFNT